MSANVGGDEIDVNLTPLLDLVLQLIMFFIITVNFVRLDQFDESVKLPVALSAVRLEETTEKWIYLNIDANGKLAGNLGLLAPEKLQSYLILEKEINERVARAAGQNGEVKTVVVIRADKDCRYRDVWQVVDSCQRAGFRRWQLRVLTGSS